MSPPNTLPTAPLPHLAMDYARLRAEGLRLLGELAGNQWTDFNAHDPGVTILEQLCYAITDFGYRANFDVPDLLAGPNFDATESLASAATILSCEPVTTTDLRKLALDASGADNVWLEVQATPACPVYHYAKSLYQDPESPDLDVLELGPIELWGLHRVLLPRVETPRAETLRRLHGSRPLGEDIAVTLLDSQEVEITVDVEVEANDRPDLILAQVIATIEGYLSPRVSFESLAEAQARAGANEAVFCGPRLERGFVDDRAFELSPRRRVIYASDLIRVINDVPGVRAVTRLRMNDQPWALKIDDDKTPLLARDSLIRLLRDGLALQLHDSLVGAALNELRRPTPAPVVIPDAHDLPIPRGRDRRLDRYRSILTQLPEIYGVGRFGLPASATPRRRAQAKQLRAYLLLFDQLLANLFAQLAHARELFSPERTKTYVTGHIEAPSVDLDELRLAPDRHASALDELDGTDELGDLDRRSRFLSHLLARYAEQLDERNAAPNSFAAGTVAQTGDFVDRKLACWREYPRLGAGRGRGCDVTVPTSCSGLAERLRIELGLEPDEREFMVVEHILLRPLDEDAKQRAGEGERGIPLLEEVEHADPYSCQISVVFRDRADDNFERFVEQLVSDRCPAHLRVTLHWLGGMTWSDFVTAHDDFRVNYACYRRARVRDTAPPVEIQLRTRDARDRLLELLDIGQTYPLRDLPLPSLVFAHANATAKIPMDYSQPGVVYQLLDPEGNPVGAELTGTGRRLELVTPIIKNDITFRVHAKKAGTDRETTLLTKVTVREGIDTTLDAVIEAPVLDPKIVDPQSSDARIIDYGSKVEVELRRSQTGVHYWLIDAATTKALSEKILGDGKDITLESVTIHEDVDLRIEGHKDDTAVLDIVLPLRVLANATVAVDMDEAIIEHGGSASLVARESQARVSYTVFARPIRDEEYRFEPAPPTIDIRVDPKLGDDSPVRVERPARKPRWTLHSGFVQRDGTRVGDGADLSFALDQLRKELMIVVRATKVHELGPLDTGSDTLETAIELEQAAAVLLKPDPNPGLCAQLDGGGAGVVVSGGQPGVFYTLTPAPPTSSAYFQQRDADDEALNKGIGQVRVQRDLVITRAPDSAPKDPSKAAPLDPLLDLPGAKIGSSWTVVARKAMTGIKVELDAKLVVEP